MTDRSLEGNRRWRRVRCSSDTSTDDQLEALRDFIGTQEMQEINVVRLDGGRSTTSNSKGENND